MDKKSMVRNLLYKILNFIRNFTYRIIGAKTVGARALVVKNNEVLLVRHTYQKGWCTIGGTVDKNESPRAALLRELVEEVGVIVLEKPELFGLYHNKNHKRDDYVAFYIVNDFEMQKNSTSSEIAEKKWFPLGNLPPDITPSTLKRIEEYLDQREKSDKW
jgi:ADP-ribose pyrophosphatase YjhB (NUDIX family)